MAFVSSCKYDVFVSYAHVDNDVLPGVEDGWVTTLVRCIKTRLAQILGRSDNYSLWVDNELSGNVSISQQITAAVRDSATLVVDVAKNHGHDADASASMP